jgi:hypothetical protein
MRAPRRVRLVDPRGLLTVLAYLSRHGGVTVDELAELVGVSYRSITRLIAAARGFGVKITYVRERHDQTVGEWVVEDWGVFDERSVRRSVRKKGEQT